MLRLASYLENTVFGLDIGYETLKLVQVDKGLKGASLVGCANITLTERILERDRFKNKSEAAALIKEACRQAKPSPITARKIVSALPETFAFSKTIQLPKMPLHDYDKAIPLAAAEYLPIPLEDTYLDYQILSVYPENDLVDILVVGAPKKLVEDYVEVANLAGFELAALETKPLAIGRALLSDKEKDGIAIIEIGTEFSRISIWDDNSIRLTTTVGTGKNQLFEALGIAYGNKKDNPAITNQNQADIALPLDNIVGETINSIKYHQNRDFKAKEIKRILLCGSGAKIGGIDRYIEREIKIPTKIAGPKLIGRNQLETEFTTSFGLSLRGEWE